MVGLFQCRLLWIVWGPAGMTPPLSTWEPRERKRKKDEDLVHLWSRRRSVAAAAAPMTLARQGPPLSLSLHFLWEKLGGLYIRVQLLCSKRVTTPSRARRRVYTLYRDLYCTHTRFSIWTGRNDVVCPSLSPPPPVPLWLTLQSTHQAGPPIIIWTEWQHSVSLSPLHCLFHHLSGGGGGGTLHIRMSIWNRSAWVIWVLTRNFEDSKKSSVMSLLNVCPPPSGPIIIISTTNISLPSIKAH